MLALSFFGSARSFTGTRVGRRLTGLAAYLLAALAAMAVGPVLFMLGDRGTVLHWANLLLDFVQ